MSCTGQELFAPHDDRLPACARTQTCSSLDAAQARVRERQAAIERRVGQQLLVERRLVKRQDVRHSTLALQDLAQLADDPRRVTLAQLRHDQPRPGVIGQRDWNRNVDRRFEKAWGS